MNKAKVQHYDGALILYSVLAVLCFFVSFPATLKMVQVFHGSDWLGTILSVLLVGVLEIGAIGCKVATIAFKGDEPFISWETPKSAGFWLNILTIALLILTALANYAYGADYAAVQTLHPTLEQWREAGYLAAATWVYAGVTPIFLYVFLSLAVLQYKRTMHEGPTENDNPTLQLNANVQALANGITVLTERLALPAPDVHHSALPRQERYNVPERVYACEECGATLNRHQYAAMKKHGRCSACPKGATEGIGTA